MFSFSIIKIGAKRVFQNRIGLIACITPILLGRLLSIINGVFQKEIIMNPMHGSWFLIGGMFSIAIFIVFFLFEIITQINDFS